MKATLFIKENVIQSLQNLIDKECLSGFALGIVTRRAETCGNLVARFMGARLRFMWLGEGTK